MKDDVELVLRYFRQFDYTPTFEEIFTFLPRKTTKKRLKAYINRTNKNTLGEYNKKIKKAMPYVGFISTFPQIQLIGLSGTMSMMNVKQEDDVDLFIISARNRLWTSRFLAITIAWLLGLKRKPRVSLARDKVCLNMFFDEKSLQVPIFKQNEYVAHEVLQMKPIINKSGAYERFLEANKWVVNYFPNSKSNLPAGRQVSKPKTSNSKTGNLIEYLLKQLQLRLINRHRTNEIISQGQLWFHPNDFQKKVKFLAK